MHPYKTSNILSDNITYLNVPGYTYLLIKNNHTNNASALIEAPDHVFSL